MRHTALLLASASVLVASPAAADEGPYIGFSGGVVFEDQLEVEPEPFEGTPPLNQSIANTGTGLDFDAVVGYDFGRFRLELEGGFKNQDHDTLVVTSSNNTLGVPGGFRTGPDSAQQTYSLMGNALVDFGDDDAVP